MLLPVLALLRRLDVVEVIGLAEFIGALQSIDASDGPVCGQPPHWYGWEPLVRSDSFVHLMLANFDGTPKGRILTRVWEDALAAPEWDGPPVFVHGDLDPANVLAAEGRLSGVIDFGVLSVGDPACEHQAAWHLLDADARAVYRAVASVDDATWTRARGWALRRGAFDEILADAEA